MDRTRRYKKKKRTRHPDHIKNPNLPNELVEFVPNVSSKRNYWLVRTSSGDNYDVFVKGNFIAIGWNEITLADLHDINVDPKNKELFKKIKSKISIDREFITDKSSRGIGASQSKSLHQLRKFVYDIKKDDIVIIPSYNSDVLSFGIIKETPAFSESSVNLAKDNCSYAKRKKIEWIKTNVSRLRLDANLYRFIFAHQTINNISEYAEYINNFLFDFYEFDGKYSLVLRLRREGAIDAFEMNQFYSDLLEFIKDYAGCDEYDKEKNSLSVKFELQSPGTIIFIAGAIIGVGLLGVALLTLLAGGENDTEIDLKNLKFKWKLKTNSLLDKLSEYLDRGAERNRNKRIDELNEREDRLLRLQESLQHFEVDQNKNLKKELMQNQSEEEN
jgi:hypothetical protein